MTDSGERMVAYEHLRDDVANCLHVQAREMHPRSHVRTRGGPCDECSDAAEMVIEIVVARFVDRGIITAEQTAR